MAGLLLEGPSGLYLSCIDPRTAVEVARVAVPPLDQVASRVEQARLAGQAWRERPLAARKQAVAALHQAFLQAGPRIVELLAQECGRPSGEAWTSEVVANNDLFLWWLGQIDDLLVSLPLDLSPINYPRKSGRVQLDPVGVIGLISPWNLPVAIPLRAIVPAILAGNAVVWKPSEHSPRTAELLAELMRGCLPEGLVQVVQGDGRWGQAVVDGGVDALFFTGSVRTGRAVNLRCAERFVPCSLELGGKDATIVLADADLDRAVEGIVWGAFAFGGQNCAAIERCYVHASIYPSFLAKIKARVERLRPLLDVGPLITPAQLALVQEHVADAVVAGATVVCGGRAPGPGWYHEPTVLTEVTPSMRLMREESFGPLLPIQPFDDLDEALRLADDSPYALSASVWTRDLDLGETIGLGLRAGVITVNNHAFTGALPQGSWGGPGDTGGGVTNSRFALFHMVRPRTIVVDALSQPHEMWWFPYNEALERLSRGLIELQRKGGAKLPGLRDALSGFTARWKDS